MAFTLRDDLAPELYPLSWLIGTWHGFGVVGYEGIAERPMVHELTFDHDGGPYLRAVSTLWEADPDHPATVSHEQTGSAGYAALAKGTQWSTETQYWRPVASEQQQGGMRVELEVLAADPAGHLVEYVGAALGPRIDLASDAVISTRTAAPLTAATYMFGLVASDLLWVKEIAAFGQSLGPYGSGRLSRVEES